MTKIDKTLAELQLQWTEEQRILEKSAIDEAMQEPLPSDEEMDRMLDAESKRIDAIYEDASGERKKSTDQAVKELLPRYKSFFNKG
jgi:hypothetical protein